jgi:iron complex transport system substrate-binding protein
MMKKINRILAALFMVAFVFTVTACTEKKAEVKTDENKSTATKAGTTYPLEVTDSFGRKVVIEKEPQKVISVAPNITETIFALDKKNVLLGRTDYCDYPEDVKDIASIGTIQEPNIEKITELSPDLVIAAPPFTKEAAAKLEELKIPVIVLNSDQNFDGTYDIINKVGEVLNASEKANSVVDSMIKKIADVESKVKGQSTPSVYYVVSFGQGGDFTATGETFINTMITMAGGKNIAADAQGWAYSLEKIVEKDPEIVICSKYFDSKKGFESTEGYRDLTAVKSGKLLEIDNNRLDRQGPRLAEGLEELAKLIHPEAFK